MKRRLRAAMWLFDRSRLARLAFVLVTFPWVFITDRWGLHGRLLNPTTFRKAWISAWRGGWELPEPPPRRPVVTFDGWTTRCSGCWAELDLTVLHTCPTDPRRTR